MSTEAFVVIDIQSDVAKHHRDTIDTLGDAIGRAQDRGMEIAYIKHNNKNILIPSFKPGTPGTDLVPELRVVSEKVFVRAKGDALASAAFRGLVDGRGMREFHVAGVDATACVKATCHGMRRAGYTLHVISDAITYYNRPDARRLHEGGMRGQEARRPSNGMAEGKGDRPLWVTGIQRNAPHGGEAPPRTNDAKRAGEHRAARPTGTRQKKHTKEDPR